MTHTPGPWTAYVCKNGYVVKDSERSEAFIETKDRTLAEMDRLINDDEYTFEQFEANALLMAAAPEMLEALELASSWVEHCYDLMPSAHDKEEAILCLKTISKAIAKASGENT